jgi:hypothetical protein
MLIDHTEASVSDEPDTPKPLFTVREYVTLEQLKKDVAFNRDDLSTAMMQQAGLFAHYAVLAAKASKQVNNLKTVIEARKGLLDKQIRQSHQDAMRAEIEGNPKAKPSKVTEAQIEAEMSRHPVMIQFSKLLNEAKLQESLAISAMESFRHRRDMLVQSGLMAREEMKGEVSIARRNAVEDSQEALRERTISRLKGESV